MTINAPQDNPDLRFLPLGGADVVPAVVEGIADPSKYIVTVLKNGNEVNLCIVVHGPSGQSNADLVINDLNEIKNKLKDQYSNLYNSFNDLLVIGDFNCPLVVGKPEDEAKALANRNAIADFVKKISDPSKRVFKSALS